MFKTCLWRFGNFPSHYKHSSGNLAKVYILPVQMPIPSLPNHSEWETHTENNKERRKASGDFEVSLPKGKTLHNFDMRGMVFRYAEGLT
jgi:hypothetical protein